MDSKKKYPCLYDILMTTKEKYKLNEEDLGNMYTVAVLKVLQNDNKLSVQRLLNKDVKESVMRRTQSKFQKGIRTFFSYINFKGIEKYNEILTNESKFEKYSNTNDSIEGEIDRIFKNSQNPYQDIGSSILDGSKEFKDFSSNFYNKLGYNWKRFEEYNKTLKHLQKK